MADLFKAGLITEAELAAAKLREEQTSGAPNAQ